jgi:hypothetical protein
MVGDYPERYALWRAAIEADKVALKHWQEQARKANDPANAPPMPVPQVSEVKPEQPRLRQHDVTIEQVAALLAAAGPKGLMIVRRTNGLADFDERLQSFWPSFLGRSLWRAPLPGRTAQTRRPTNRYTATGCFGLWRNSATAAG